MRKLSIIALLALLALAVVPLAQAKKVPTLPSIDGAVYTTVDLGDANYPNECKNGNPAVNCNQYAAKQYVFLNGGPTKNHLTPDGVYFFAVLSPGGQANPNDGASENLSDDYDCYQNREIVIKNGEVAAVLKSTDPACFHNQTALAVGTAHKLDNPFVQLAPYADTTSPGGVYMMAVCYVGPAATTPTSPLTLAAPVTPSLCKYDAFKVLYDKSPPVCKLISKTATSISVAVQDVGAGLESVDYTTYNATASFPSPLSVGTTKPYYVNAAKANASSHATLRLVVTDVAGNQLTCDPVFGVKHRQLGQALVPAGTHARLVVNAAAGSLSIAVVRGHVRNAVVFVNGRRFASLDLMRSRRTTLDLRSALSAHHASTVVVKAGGHRGAIRVKVTN